MAAARDWFATAGRPDMDVLECGSFDVNGGIRGLIEPFVVSYVGVDRYAGPGVDRLCDAERLPFAADTFSAVVSTESLEHADRPWRVWAEMARVLVPGGPIFATLRGFNESASFPFHNPPDTTRLSERGVRVQVEDAGLTEIQILPDPQVPGWFVIARKPAP